ncbi:MAG: hypothetical protein V4692_02470 [Bdellovibrionota bacterium]
MKDQGPKAAPKSASDRRIAPRENVDPIEIRAFTSIDHMTLLSRRGFIVEASTTGFLLNVERKDLVPKEFRDTLSIDVLKGDQVILMIDPLNLEISGKIARTKRVTKDLYEIAIDYSDDAPEYWRECLMELLPRGEDYD